jgi:uroporphyrinogen-III synthase
VPEAAASSLLGKRVVVTRAESQAAELLQKLSARGAVPVLLPLISFAPPEDYAAMDSALARLDRFDWVFFTSANAVRSVADRCQTLGRRLDSSSKFPRIAAVGPKTAEALEKAGLTVTYVAKTHSGASLAEELGPELTGRSVLLPRSDRANPDLPAALRRFGAIPTELAVYRTLQTTEVDQQKLRGVLDSQASDAILFFSPSAVHHFTELIGREQWPVFEDRVTIAAIGPVTAGVLRKNGVQQMLVANDTTPDAVIAALEQHFAATQEHAKTGARRA